MSDGDITFRALRSNWPIVLVVVSLIAGGVRVEMEINANDARLQQLAGLLEVSKLPEFTVGQVGIERDIQDLRNACQ